MASTQDSSLLIPFGLGLGQEASKQHLLRVHNFNLGHVSHTPPPALHTPPPICPGMVGQTFSATTAGSHVPRLHSEGR